MIAAWRAVRPMPAKWEDVLVKLRMHYGTGFFPRQLGYIFATLALFVAPVAPAGAQTCGAALATGIDGYTFSIGVQCGTGRKHGGELRFQPANVDGSGHVAGYQLVIVRKSTTTAHREPPNPGVKPLPQLAERGEEILFTRPIADAVKLLCGCADSSTLRRIAR